MFHAILGQPCPSALVEQFPGRTREHEEGYQHSDQMRDMQRKGDVTLALPLLLSCEECTETTQKKKLCDFSPQVNYTDRVMAACRRSLCHLLWKEGVEWSAQRIPTAVFSVSRPELLLFLSSSSSIVLTRLSGHHSRPTTSQKIWQCRELNLDLWIYSQEL
jgi:hypothetical protein